MSNHFEIQKSNSADVAFRQGPNLHMNLHFIAFTSFHGIFIRVILDYWNPDQIIFSIYDRNN